tara:strand:- start:553 stop:675 length:123 start_codon:yes stop_codon:yes gene_type:complete
MILIFHLQRPDVFAEGYLGIKKAMYNFYGNETGKTFIKFG